MLLEVRHAVLKEQEKPFSIWTWWIVNPMQWCSAGYGGERERERKETGEGLPRALRSSSKFSLLFIFQVPAKLGMSAEAECEGCRKNLFHAVMPLSLSFLFPLSLFDSFSPSSSFPVLLSPLLWAQPLRSHCYTRVFLWVFFYLFIYFSSHSLASCVCLSALAAILSLALL